jgi:hypothetical protein
VRSVCRTLLPALWLFGTKSLSVGHFTEEAYRDTEVVSNVNSPWSYSAACSASVGLPSAINSSSVMLLDLARCPRFAGKLTSAVSLHRFNVCCRQYRLLVVSTSRSLLSLSSVQCLVSFTSFYHLLPFIPQSYWYGIGMALVVLCDRLTAVYHLLSHVYLLVSPQVRFSADVAQHNATGCAQLTFLPLHYRMLSLYSSLSAAQSYSFGISG